MLPEYQYTQRLKGAGKLPYYSLLLQKFADLIALFLSRFLYISLFYNNINMQEIVYFWGLRFATKY